MAKMLFPVVEIPEITLGAEPARRKYLKSLCFDFESGDFRRDGMFNIIVADGKTAYEQWCRKVVLTERGSCLAYSQDIGTEMEDALNQPSAAAVKSAVERTITEALMVSPITEYVRDFVFDIKGDSMQVSFVVKGKDWEEMRISTQING